MEKASFFVRENLRLLLGLIVVLLVSIIIISIFMNRGNTTSTKVSVNDQTFKVTVAKTDKEKQIGLSNTERLSQDQGMLFLFDNADYYSFWMKEMKFPIDIIYINGNKVTTIIENAAPPTNGNLPTYQPKDKSDKVLEVNAGLAKKYNIQEGTTIEINDL